MCSLVLHGWAPKITVINTQLFQFTSQMPFNCFLKAMQAWVRTGSNMYYHLVALQHFPFQHELLCRYLNCLKMFFLLKTSEVYSSISKQGSHLSSHSRRLYSQPYKEDYSQGLGGGSVFSGEFPQWSPWCLYMLSWRKWLQSSIFCHLPLKWSGNKLNILSSRAFCYTFN